MDFSSIKAITIPEGTVTKITASGIILWQAVTYKNWVKLSTESDGVTTYNGGLGYKNGYRIRSGGAEAAAGQSSHTGFIPAVGGNIIRLSGYDVKYTTNQNAINVYDSSHTNLGQISANSSWSYGIFDGQEHNWNDVIDEGNGVYYWVIPDGYDIAYIRVTGYTLNDGSKMIVTVNEEIT